MKYLLILIHRLIIIISITLFISNSHAQNIRCVVQKLYVSPDGNDLNNGTQDRPFANLKAAIVKAKQLKAKSVSPTIEIVISSGDYHLEEPIIIGPELSGRQSQPFKIVAERNATVSLSGGKKLELSWENAGNGIWKAKVSNGLNFQRLYADGKLLIRARYPNYDPTIVPFNGYSEDAISKDRIKSWENPGDGIVHALHVGRWGGFHYRIVSKQGDEQLKFEGGQQNNRPSAMHDTYRFVENIFEEMDEEHEWFLDTNSSTLYFIPQEDEDPNQAIFIAPVLENLISIFGSHENPVHDIMISGIHFKHTAPTFMKTTEPLLRSDWTIYRQGAVRIEGAERCLIESSDFVELGGNAIFLSNYNRGVKVSGNLIANIGAGAINFVGDPNAVRSPSFQYSEFVNLESIDKLKGPKSENYPKDCEVSDNLIYNIGQIEKQVAGIQISMSQSLKILHNTIYDVPRAGINVGDGTWGGHDISFNDVFNTVLETSDHGAFNSWGRDRFWHPDRITMDKIVENHPELIILDAIETTKIHNNRFRCDHGWDIDLDDGSSNYEIFNNLCLNGGLKLREGFYRKVYNNLLINNGFHPHVWFKDSHDVFKNNLVMSAHQDIQIKYWGDMVDFNIYGSVADKKKDQDKGIEKNASVLEFDFVDAKAGDFRLQNDDLKGFNNFDLSLFGVRVPRLKSLAKSPDIPAINLKTEDKQNELLNWKGGTFKSVMTLGEQSAAGLSSMAGVLILDIEENSMLVKSGLRKGDVILGFEGEEIKSVDDFQTAIKKYIHVVQPSLIIFRNQEKQDQKLLL